MGMHVQLFGQSAIRLLDGGVDYSQAPPVTLAACLRQNGGADVAEVRRTLLSKALGTATLSALYAQPPSYETGTLSLWIQNNSSCLATGHRDSVEQ